MLELNDVCFSYDKRLVIAHFSLRMKPGEHLLLCGPSGCGKSTLLSLIAGLKKPTSGQIRCKAGKIALQFQDLRLPPWLTAVEQVNLVLSDRKQTLPQAVEWLKKVELADSADKPPEQLSGGMRKRLALARVLAYDGDLVLLDEPFEGMDPALRERMNALVTEACRDKTLIMVSHHPEDGEGICEKNIYLPEGGAS